MYTLYDAAMFLATWIYPYDSGLLTAAAQLQSGIDALGTHDIFIVKRTIENKN